MDPRRPAEPRAGGWLARRGVEARAFVALVRAFALMDLRSHHYAKATGAKPNEVIPPLYWAMSQMLAFSALLSLSLFARTDVWFFAFAGLSAHALLLLSALIVEMDELVLAPQDRLVLGARPVTGRTLALARLTNLLSYVGVMSLALSIFPAIVGAGLEDAGPLYLPSYLLTSTLTSLVITSGVVLLRTGLSALSGLAQARAMLAWVQILGIVVIFYALQLMLRDATGNLELFAAMPPAWLADLPSGWLATLVARASWDPSRELLGPLLFALLITLSLGVLTLWALARHYAARGGARASSRRALEARPPHRGTLLGRLDRILRRSRLEGAGRWLALRILEREPDTKMRVWIGLGLPAAILALCLLDPAQAGNPLRERGARLVLPLALLPTLAAAVPSALFALSMSSEHRAAWLLARAPGARDALARGAVIAALDTIFLPLLLLGWAIFSFAWGSIADAALHILLAWLVLVTTAHGCGRAVLGRVPFSERPVRAAMSGKVALLAGVSTALAMGVGALYYALAGRPLAILGLGAALGALAWATKRWGWHQGRATERTSLPSESHHG